LEHSVGWYYEYREAFRRGLTADSRLTIDMDCGHGYWIFDQTPWTDADQNLTIRTLLLTGHDMEQHCRAPTTLLSSAAAAAVNLNREDVEWAKYKNKQGDV